MGRMSLRVLGGPAAQGELAQAVESFFARCAARGLAEGTVTFYRQRLSRFTDFLSQAGITSLGGATAAVVRDFLAAERERVSAAAAAKARTTLCAFFSYLEREGLVSENPMPKVERVKAPQKLVRPLTEEEVERLLALCNNRTFLGCRLRALLLVMLDCGLRASEVCGLDLEDVDLSAATLRVRHAKGGKERELPFGQATREALVSYLARRGELAAQALFVTHYGDRLDRGDVRRILVTAGKRAGVTGVHPHRLRHSAATFFLRGGGNIFALQRMLGHSSLAMVRRYAEVTQSDLVEQHRACSPGDRFMSAVKATQGRKRLR